MSFSRNKKEWIKECLDKLDAHEHRQVLEIVKQYTDKVTKTQSGVLVSSDELPLTCLQDIEKYVLFCMDQRKRLDEDLKQRKSCERQLNKTA